MPEKFEDIHCNSCNRDTEHKFVCDHRNKEFNEDEVDEMGRVVFTVWGYHDWQLLECQGCKEVTLRKRQFFSEWSDPRDGSPFADSYHPPRRVKARVKPRWYDGLTRVRGLRNSFILDSYKQIYSQMEDGHYIGALLTCRALLETIAIVHGDGDRRTFREKLVALKENDLLRERQIDPINTAIFDAGSAAMHRGYRPTLDVVNSVLDSIEALLYTVYIEPIEFEKIRNEIPPRR